MIRVSDHNLTTREKIHKNNNKIIDHEWENIDLLPPFWLDVWGSRVELGGLHGGKSPQELIYIAKDVDGILFLVVSWVEWKLIGYQWGGGWKGNYVMQN